MSKKGIDISEHNGNAEAAIKTADFVMIRSSWGHFAIDKKLEDNVKLCKKHGKPYGFYHFSYARNYKEAKDEAHKCMNLISRYGNTYPIALDLEWDDGANWKKNNGITYQSEMEVLKAWKEVVEQECKTYLLLYCNRSFYNQLKAVNEARLKSVDLWLAEWGVSEPSIPCGMWQYRGDPLDLDVAYYDYPTLLKGLHKGNSQKPTTEIKVGDKVSPKEAVNYDGVKLIADVKGMKLDVIEISGDRIVVSYPTGGTEAFAKSNLKK
jgi:hypothetical protein